MERVVIAAVIVVVVVALAVVLRRRAASDPPTQRRYSIPQQLDRDDFPRPEAPWLVAVFTSATCDACAAVADRAAVLETAQVSVAEVEFGASRELHQRYSIDAVPTVVIADADGVTRASFLGPVNATDLWAAVAEVREPGSTPEPDLGHAPG
jgi:hypothetical protein